MGIRNSTATVGRLPQRLLITLVQGYRCVLSPWLGSSCRFEPTCSAYSLEALRQHGAAGGSYLTLRRLVRCHPWCAAGIDPVPATAPFPFTRLLAKPAVTRGRPTPQPVDCETP